jgi:hypothetical protein
MRECRCELKETARAQKVSSFTIIKGALIDETYLAFGHWDFSLSKARNFARLRDTNLIGGKSANWLRDVSKALHRRFVPEGRDRPLVELAQRKCPREVWRPLLLWHITRDEFLLRDFLINWLFPERLKGVFRIRKEDVIPYIQSLPEQGVTLVKRWSTTTSERLATGLLRISVDFGLMTGKLAREFAPFHLPDESFLYLLHAMAEEEHNAHRIIHSPDWRMYLMDPNDVERELLRLHQYRKLRYEVAGSVAQLELPCRSLLEYAREIVR